jgi:uncharacterized surface protein with fasciclin (FAS1) repeats
MKKFFLLMPLAVLALLSSCVDKYEEVDADSKPSFLGESIFEELSNPARNGLQGTFNTYKKLISDLGESETLSRTGSKTIFPANDEAFDRFFQSNIWGVRSYEQLSNTQKKLLLYSSMIDNSLLLSMLPNVSSGTTDVVKGQAVKHQTSISVIDSVTHIDGKDLPKNNQYWDKYRQKSGGMYIVSDATRPMMVHFTREHMLNNNITVSGEQSDFAILTGSPYTEGSAYIFDDQVITSDVTCKNGYIHQVKDVLVPPGNMADVLARSENTTIFNHILDYYAAPYYNATITNNYNAWAIQNGYQQIDSIFEKRYLSSRSQNATLIVDPNGKTLSTSGVLSYDPGWNQYYPASAYNTGLDNTITDIGAMFIPTDNAVKKYFLPGGAGAYLIDIYGKKDNTEANLIENLDSLHIANNQILTAFVRNLQKSSFVATVPSKFTTISNDASENMGMNMSYLQTKGEGKYDIRFANNGVIYILKDMIAPDEYQAVLAPSSSYPDMRVMNWAVQDRTYLGIDFRFYLLAMSANYAFFIPDDEAFDQYYIDPTTLGHSQQEVIRFWYDTSVVSSQAFKVQTYKYNPQTGEVGDLIATLSLTNQNHLARIKSALSDILNFHTVILEEGDSIGMNNNYYKTKHGGEIYVDGGKEGNHVYGASQLYNGITPSKIEVDYKEKNGHAYRIDHVIQAPQESVSKVLQNHSQFSEFYKLCSGFAADNILSWIGIDATLNEFGTSEQDQYTIFTSTYGTGDSKIQRACLDENVKMFNTYNYTLYAPDNAAMEKAYAAGLPNWEEVEAVYTAGLEETDEAKVEAMKSELWTKVKAMRDFCRFHFQSISLYADNKVEGGTYQTLSYDNVGVSLDVTVTGGNKKLVVKDLAGVEHTIDATDPSKLTNRMTRDYWFNSDRASATAITTSSFCAVHEITEPLFNSKNKRYDAEWATKASRVKAQKEYVRRKAINRL